MRLWFDYRHFAYSLLLRGLRASPPFSRLMLGLDWRMMMLIANTTAADFRPATPPAASADCLGDKRR